MAKPELPAPRTWFGVQMPRHSVQKALGSIGKGATTSAVVAAVLATASGCRTRMADAPQRVTVGQLAAMLESQDPPRLYDANGERTRKEYGVIPGATLLPSSSDYALNLLPPSKAVPLVFYCASSWCGAAESAADRAKSAGYVLVSVLPDGIKGWKEAGMPTHKVNGGAGS
jgi:rhodanese-related sulfurtransferase